MLYRNPECHPQVSKYRTDLIGIELHHKLQLLESGLGSYKQFAFLVIFASCISKSGKTFPSIDCDVTSSSIEVAFSTSLIHDIVSVGQGVFAHTSVLKLAFQHWKSTESGNFPRCSSEIECLVVSILGISSSSMILRIPYSRSFSKTRSWYCRIVRLSSHSFSLFHNVPCITLS